VSGKIWYTPGILAAVRLLWRHYLTADRMFSKRKKQTKEKKNFLEMHSEFLIR
jgi:hypothetical protein